MKKIFVLVFGLMSLITLSSCEDYFAYNDENEFMPYGYIAKSVDNKASEGDPIEATTLQIQGSQELIFDEIEKTDWKIITTANFETKGNAPLKILFDNMLLISNPKEIMEIPTSCGNIPITFGNTSVTYEYLGQMVELLPIGGLHLIVSIQEMTKTTEPYFIQCGYIMYYLCVGYVVVKKHKQFFSVIDTDEAISLYSEYEGKDDTAD